jgi:DNA primase
VFRGIRPDVSPKDCTVAPDDGIDLGSVEDEGELETSSLAEEPPPPSLEPGELPVELSATPARATRTRRIHVTAPTQVLFSDGTTKDALCKYFEAVAPALLRHARGRACTLARPDGTTLWPPPKWTPKFARTTTIRAGTREVRGFIIDSVDTLLFAVEAGSPSVQHWPFIEGRADIADFVAVRIMAPVAADPADLATSARSVRDLAAEIGLPSAVKSAGARSLEVLIGVGAAPAQAAAPLGTLLAHLALERAPRGMKIEATETVRTPFTPCATPLDGPVVVAVPIGWDELDRLAIITIGIEAAIERASSAVLTDSLDAITDAAVDIGAATNALEDLIANRT